MLCECADCVSSFGVAANLLEMVPIAGIFFAFTNQVGAALWSADLEKQTNTLKESQQNGDKEL